jgi:predicted nuclease with TOPRIM domain
MMAKQNIIEDVKEEKKDSLSSRKGTLSSKFFGQKDSPELNEDIKTLDVEETGIRTATKKELQSLRSELEEKKQMIAEMINNIRPVETDIEKRADLVESLKRLAEERSARIEALSDELAELKKGSQDSVQEKDSLRKQAAEKDSMLKVLKDKLTETAGLLNRSQEKNAHLEGDIESYKKKVFELDNKVKAVEQRVFSTNDQNQKLLYELMKNKEHLKQLEAQHAQKQAIMDAQSTDYDRQLEDIRREEEAKRLIVMKTHSKKISVLKASLDLLRSKLEKQNRLVGEKIEKEAEIISEFNSKMQDLVASSGDYAVDMGSMDSAIKGLDAPEPTEETSQEPASQISAETQPETVQELSQEPVQESEEKKEEEMPEFDVASVAKQDEPPSPGDSISKMAEILPMIELALDHGDSKDTVVHSLKSSGYSEKDIEEAFSKVNIVEQK